MRILALLAQLLVAVASIGSLSWWLAGGLMRLAARWLERSPLLRTGPLGAVAAVLFGIAGALSAAAWVLALLLFRAMVDLPQSVGLQQSTVTVPWHVLTVAASVLLGVAGSWAALGAAATALGAARRRRFLTELLPFDGDAALQDGPELPPPTTGGRRIVILCDGTSNRPGQTEGGLAVTTNVYKLFTMLAADEIQTTWYQAGVGSDTSSTARQVRRTQAILGAIGANAGSQVAAYGDRLIKLIESAFGTGISEGIVNGYAEIVRQYRPGDRIYLCGFSRGAYTARCIAGVISRIGLLRAEHGRYAPQMVQLYRNRADQHARVAVRPCMVHADPAIEFVGVFDTVASLGVPLWGWWFRVLPIWKLGPLQTDPVEACRHVYHALSMDERRSEFFPTLYTDPRAQSGGRRSARDKLETLQQVWFRGAHADIGGGYARCDLSDITLGWMLDAMQRHGLRVRDGARDTLRPDPLGPLHDELKRNPGWVLFGSWPRWHPTPGAGPDSNGTALHPSVLERATTVEARTGRPDFIRLQPGADRVIVVEAGRSWDRTGIVIERGATYRLSYLGGLWRDADATPCTGAGQNATGLFDLRRTLTIGRRLREEPWMRLVATVAHPRRWPLLERGFVALLRILLVRDPDELTCQLAPIGRDLGRKNAAVLIRNEAQSGLLYLFANDWWQAASNNSGGLQLRIERVAGDAEASPVWTLDPAGRWQRS